MSLFRKKGNAILPLLMKQPPSDRATAEQEAAAKELLRKTMLHFEKRFPKTQLYRLQDRNLQRADYYGNLLRLRRELESGKWCDACYSLCKVLKYYCANDTRTIYTVFGILEESL